jgi:serine-type D-Ala-D-Ala carboxypeptidase/endopeptidase (penicillin-binding protein 4)
MKHTTPIIAFFAFICMMSTTSSAHYRSFKTSIPLIYGQDELAYEVDQSVRSVSRYTAIGVYIKSMRTGEILYKYKARQAFIPASILKLMTAEAALLYLGPQYRFATKLMTNAKSIDNGVLKGNLYVVLNGDPTLTFDDIQALVIALKAKQIQAIAGNVYIDNSAYDKNFYGPGWEGKDKSYCYAAPISASIINHNCLSFKVEPAKVTGQYAQVTKYANYYYPAIHNSVMTRNRNMRNCFLRLSQTSSTGISINGCVPKGTISYGMSYVVTDIPDYNRSLFKNLLSRMSIRVFGQVSFAPVPPQATMLSLHYSQPLPNLINEMMKKSDNIIAGALFKKIGQVYTRRPGSWETGSFAVKAILQQKVGMNLSDTQIIDGSGLSRHNAVSPSHIMDVLTHAYHNKTINDLFISALPIAGVDGTLKHRLNNASKRVYAKTGTMSGVVSLAGYAMSADYEPLAFVIIVNGLPGFTWQYRSLEDQIVTLLVRYKR